jgi:3-phosphoglycerate kinase
MGVFELEKFNNGTKKILECVANQTDNGKLTIVGGGDTASAVKMFNSENKISHVSTGGGASLELMEGKELPGISILYKKN